MQVRFLQPFSRQIDTLRDPVLRNRLGGVVAGVKNAATIRDIPNVKKLKGHKSAYRIRLGDFRIGLYVEGDTAIFADFDHRKDIYGRFPD
jgi:mRNA interferase RelE/StbE